MADLAEAFEWYADWATDVTPLYERLARGTSEDDRLLDVAAEAQEGQPPPQLLLAAVHHLLLRGSDHRLARFYPSCGGGDADGDPVPAFRDFCLSHEAELRRLVSTRRVQTNAVGRSAVLLPAFEHVARTADSRTLTLVELGASSGLNLNWDRYRYDYGAAGTAGDEGSPVRIETDVRGDHEPPLPEDLHSVADRVGIDLNPLDPTDPEDGRWLHALVHPDQPRRHDLLEAAIEVARDHPPRVVEGDVLAALPDVLDERPEEGTLIVYSTHFLYQLDDETVAELRELLSARSAERPVYWLSIDPSEDLGEPTYRLVTFDGDGAEEHQLAEFESYGEWLRWLAE